MAELFKLESERSVVRNDARRWVYCLLAESKLKETKLATDFR